MRNPPIDLSPLSPFMSLTDADRALAADFAGPDLPRDPDAAAFHKANDAKALRLQIQRKLEQWI